MAGMIFACRRSPADAGTPPDREAVEALRAPWSRLFRSWMGRGALFELGLRTLSRRPRPAWIQAASATPDPAECARWLLAVAERRDRDAFERLFRHYAPRLQRYMLHARMDREVAEDLVQETLVEVWRKAALYRAEIAGASTWIFTIARNLRIDRLRRRRRPEVPLELEVHGERGEEPDHGRAVDAGRPIALLDDLPAGQRQVMRLAYLEGLSQSEIATRLGLPLSTVESRLRLAFAKTRKSIDPD